MARRYVKLSEGLKALKREIALLTSARDFGKEWEGKIGS